MSNTCHLPCVLRSPVAALACTGPPAAIPPADHHPGFDRRLPLGLSRPRHDAQPLAPRREGRARPRDDSGVSHQDLSQSLRPSSPAGIPRTTASWETPSPHPTSAPHFSMDDRQNVRDGRFWLAEPIWVTAERQGQRTAPFFWPGSEAAIAGVRPTYSSYLRPRSSGRGPRRARARTGSTCRPAGVRRFITMYLSGVDNAGHSYGPDAPETRAAIAHADSIIGTAGGGDERAQARRQRQPHRRVGPRHGRAQPRPRHRARPVSPARMDRRGRALSHADGVAPCRARGLDVRSGSRRVAAPRGLPRERTCPRDFIWRGGRVPPVVAIADPGWKIRWATSGTGWNTNGDHGYDDTVTDMRAIFVARGPAFRSGVVVPPFRNIHSMRSWLRCWGLNPSGRRVTGFGAGGRCVSSAAGSASGNPPSTVMMSPVV